MKSNYDNIKYYIEQLKIGKVQEGYREIISFISNLKSHMEKKYVDYISTTIYIGYMDMTYFGFTPINIKNKNLKIAIVYLHEENRFEVWLSGVNKEIQKKNIEVLKNININDYKLSKSEPGIDSIIEYILEDNPNFNNKLELINDIEVKTIKFIDSINKLII